MKYEDVRIGEWYRTCQECGEIQLDKEPRGKPSIAYENRICRYCKSEGLDYGTNKTEGC